MRESQRESFDALKMIITISKSGSEENVHPPATLPLSLFLPHLLLFCPLPLNTTAQWLSRTRWAVSVC